MKLLVGTFNQPGEGQRRDLLRDFETSNFARVRFQLYYPPHGNVGPVSIRHISQHHCPPPHRRRSIKSAANNSPVIQKMIPASVLSPHQFPLCSIMGVYTPRSPTGSSAPVFACSQQWAVAILHSFGIELCTNSLKFGYQNYNGGQKLQCSDLKSFRSPWLFTMRACNRFHIVALNCNLKMVAEKL